MDQSGCGGGSSFHGSSKRLQKGVPERRGRGERRAQSAQKGQRGRGMGTTEGQGGWEGVRA